MPYDDPDPQDPLLLVGVELPCGSEAELDMAYTFAEEFTRLGYDEAEILDLFRKPFYAGAYRAYLDLGEAEVKASVSETAAIWGPARIVDGEPEDPLRVVQGFKS